MTIDDRYLDRPEHRYDLEPERKLLAAVIRSAVHDLTRPEPVDVEPNVCRAWKRDYESAWRFFIGETGAFQWMCDVLGLDADAILERAV